MANLQACRISCVVCVWQCFIPNVFRLSALEFSIEFEFEK